MSQSWSQLTRSNRNIRSYFHLQQRCCRWHQQYVGAQALRCLSPIKSSDFSTIVGIAYLHCLKFMCTNNRLLERESVTHYRRAFENVATSKKNTVICHRKWLYEFSNRRLIGRCEFFHIWPNNADTQMVATWPVLNCIEGEQLLFGWVHFERQTVDGYFVSGLYA